MSDKKYRWAGPHEWLDHRIQKLVSAEDAKTLGQDFMQLAHQVTADEIQDLFQSDMVADGFFRPLEGKEDSDE
jgi:hypothetical protein